jgi:predicted anti-sigma-YlaC factor YlaD
MLDTPMLKQIIREIMATRSDEIDCDGCLEELDRFAEMVLAGKDAAQALPLVEDHLQRCKNCREEFEALLVALRSLA